MPKDSLLASVGPLFIQCAETAGKSLTIMDTMRASIEEAGFINVHEKNYKMPIGPWPKHPVYRDAGRVTLEVWKKGMEGMSPQIEDASACTRSISNSYTGWMMSAYPTNYIVSVLTTSQVFADALRSTNSMES